MTKQDDDISILSEWADSVHHAGCGPNGEWDDDSSLPNDWWDTVESRFDPDDEETVESSKAYDPDQPRNPHGEWTSGGGSSEKEPPKVAVHSLEESKRIFNDLMSRMLGAERDEKTLSTEMRRKGPKERAEMAIKLLESTNATSLLRYDAITERLSQEARDPARFVEVRVQIRKEIERQRTAELVLTKEMAKAGVTTIDPRKLMSARRLGDNVGCTIDRGWIKIDHNGPVEKFFARARKLSDKANALDVRIREGTSRAYYDEPDVIRQLPGLLGKVDKLVSKNVPRGGGSEALKKFMRQADVCVNLSETALGKIVTDGGLKNRFAGGNVLSVGTGEDKADYDAHRKQAEARLFGIPTMASGEDRPVYGYMEHPDRQLSMGDALGSNYGQVQLVLKPEVKGRSTYTMGDSLDDNNVEHPRVGAANDPAKHSGVTVKPDMTITATEYGEVARPIRYVEAQVFGGVKLSDIQEVRVPYNVKLHPKVSEVLLKASIGVSLVPSECRQYINRAMTWDKYLDRD